MSKKSITIIGPTASGKSDMAIGIAKKFNGEIISADSRQIHRYLDIGTGKEPGKITLNQNRGPYTKKAYLSSGVPHYMIDIIQPNTIYNVQKFVKKSKNIRNDIWARNKLPIVAGGTMFWAQALLENSSFPAVKPNTLLRSVLRNKSTETLYEKLQKLDPVFAKKVDKNNPVRLIRAIEIATELGSVPEPKVTKINPDEHLIIAISHPREILFDRIEKRMDKWFDEGIFQEIKNAHYKLKVPWSRLEGFGLEYKWCTKYVRGQISFEQMRENTIRDLKKYARRQETWIRRWEKQGTKIHRITIEKDAIKICKDFL
ncbi:MAG: tRNA (adenosine(37)-N6)-dimethylallyltransferase MiaA [Candidatus Moraniibacteriota bacterium]|jgi:tRNA dimethylallyltransferase